MDDMTDAELKRKLQKIIITQVAYKLNTLMFINEIPFDNLTAVALRLLARQIEIGTSIKVNSIDEIPEKAKRIISESEVELDFLLSELK